jgi:hypothetical protein
MMVHSPDPPALLSEDAIRFGSKTDQRQAPVTAEKQRRAMRLRTSPVACFGLVLMRIALCRTQSAQPNIERSHEAVNEMAFYICRRHRLVLLRA